MEQAVGNHNLTFRKIFNLIDNTFRKKFVAKCVCDSAAKLLYIAHGINIKNSEFYKVRLGDDINVLITYDYLGSDNRDYVYDFAIIDNAPTLLIFADTLLNPKVPETVRTYRLHSIFTMLVELYSKQEFMNIIGSMYESIILYAPMVMTVRIIETFYNREFKLSRDYKADMFDGLVVYNWFDEEALDIIHKCSDAALLNYGALVEHLYNNA